MGQPAFFVFYAARTAGRIRERGMRHDLRRNQAATRRRCLAASRHPIDAIAHTRHALHAGLSFNARR